MKLKPYELSILVLLCQKHPDKIVNLDELNLSSEARRQAEIILEHQKKEKKNV